MALDHAQLERLLCERLCADVRIHRRHDDVLMLESPFTFPDGDHYPIYLSETTGGGVKLSDRGHTLMHVSYEHDVDSFYKGARASLREQIVRESGIDEEGGVFSTGLSHTTSNNETSSNHKAPNITLARYLHCSLPTYTLAESTIK